MRARPSTIPALLVASVLLGGLSCQRGGSEEPAAAPVELVLYNFAEYMDPEILADFEKRTGVHVEESYYESTEEMEAKLAHAAGTRQYDLVVVTDQAVPRMARQGLLAHLDHARLPHLEQLAPRFRALDVDPDNQWSVAYQWGTVGLLYDAAKLGVLEPSWDAVFAPDGAKGTFLLIDELRDQMGVALKALGHSVNAEDKEAIGAAADLLVRAKHDPRSLGFEGGVGGKNRVASGGADMAVVWNGDALRAIEEGEEGRFAYFVPREGSILWTDTIAIPSEAPHPAEAHAFIDFLLEPEIAARLSSYNKFATPVPAAIPLLPPEDAANPALYPSEETMARLESLRDVGEALRLYDEAWTAVKSR